MPDSRNKSTSESGHLGVLGSNAFARFLFYASAVAVWVAMAAMFERIPAVTEVVEQLYLEFVNGEVLENFGLTLFRFGAALLIASVLGISVGLLTGLSPIARLLVGDAVFLGLSMPGLIWAFLTIMWFGFGWKAPVATAVLTATPFIAINVGIGVRSVSRDLRDMSAAYGVDLRLRLRHLILPAVTGYLIAGLRFGIINGWNAVLLSEWFGAGNGVGFRARYWYNANLLAGFAAWVALFVGFILILDRLVLQRLSQRAFRWKEDPVSKRAMII